MASRKELSIAVLIIVVAVAGIVGYFVFGRASESDRDLAVLNEAHAYRRTLARELAKDPELGRVGLTLNNPKNEDDHPSLTVDGSVPDQAALDRLKALMAKSKSPCPVDMRVRVQAAPAPK